MYNRYIPQPDGTYRKRKMEERRVAEPPCPKPEPPVRQCPKPEVRHRSNPGKELPELLGKLIPKNFDPGDLLVILLLLLQAGENEDERSTALLTLALYFFL